uniref:Transmembrane protein n=1 Tax=Cajanus cajan TaxID=3821 RepID=A0A151TTK2_CAJCA|nr:hypothetical protein KK1_009531 [Cajanus cajan]
MGRRVPIESLSLIHPLIYLSFVAAGFAASMAIITAMCGIGFLRKPSTPPAPSSDPVESVATPPSDAEAENDEDKEMQKELPLPPALQPKDPFIAERMKRVTSERKAPLSLSIKMPRSLSVARNWEHHHHKEKEEKVKGKIEGKLKAEESVWMKTIILGEKCVPDQESDAVLYEGKGKRITAYHTKRHSTASFLDTDALSSAIPQTQTIHQNNIITP